MPVENTLIMKAFILTLFTLLVFFSVTAQKTPVPTKVDSVIKTDTTVIVADTSKAVAPVVEEEVVIEKVPAMPERTTLRMEPKVRGKDVYRFFYLDNFKLDFVNERPKRGDPNVLLCVPGAYTDQNTLEPRGLYIVSGETYHKKKSDKNLVGAVTIMEDEPKFFTFPLGQVSKTFIGRMEEKKGCFFQQTLLIENGQVTLFDDNNQYQRRAFVLFPDGPAIVENTDPVTMDEFVGRLKELGAKEAVYLEMSFLSEGWYRNEAGEAITIGEKQKATETQSNWLLIRK